jgi:hypothetical protein
LDAKDNTTEGESGGYRPRGRSPRPRKRCLLRELANVMVNAGFAEVVARAVSVAVVGAVSVTVVGAVSVTVVGAVSVTVVGAVSVAVATPSSGRRANGACFCAAMTRR